MVIATNCGRVGLFGRDHGKPVERQHGAVAEMKAGQRGGQDQQRLAFEQHGDAADLALVILAFLVSPRASSSSIAALGIISTEMIDSTPNAAASDSTAVNPNCHPSRPDSPAPTMLPAWLNAWL